MIEKLNWEGAEVPNAIDQLSGKLDEVIEYINAQEQQKAVQGKINKYIQ